MELKIATWNISGGVSKDVSVEEYFDQDKSQEIDKTFLNEIIKIIKEKEIDIISFQEIITTMSIKYIETIAEKTDLKNYRYFELSDCNLVENTKCGIVIMSKYSIIDDSKLLFTNPKLSKTTKTGSTYYTYDKGCLEVSVNVLGKQINVITNHGFPFRRFESDPIKHLNIFKEFSDFILKYNNVIITGDFNAENVIELMPEINNKVSNTFGEVTTIDGKKFDDILLDKKFKIIDKELIHSLSDHFLCIVKIDI